MISLPNLHRGGRSAQIALAIAAAAPALSMLAAPRPAAAQQTPGMGAPGMAAPTANPLNLTDDQKNKMKAIQLKYKPAADKLREQMRALAMKADKEMTTLLTPAQKAKLKQLQAAQLQQMRQMQQMQGGAGGTRPR